MRYWISFSSFTLICTVPFATHVRAQESNEPTQATITVHEVESSRLIDRVSGRAGATLLEVEFTDDGVARSEDMEILGRLLQSALGEQYQWPPSVVSAHPHWSQGTRPSADIGSPDAVYLPEYGVVFTANAPPLRNPQGAKKVEAEFQIEEIDDWERARRRLRGQQVSGNVVDLSTSECRNCHSGEVQGYGASPPYTAYGQMGQRYAPSAPATPAQSSVPSPRAPSRTEMTDTLVETLAEHGHRLRGIAPKEQVTIALTFREPAKRVRFRTSAEGAFSSLGQLGGQGGEAVNTQAIQLSDVGVNSDAGLIGRIVLDQSSPGDLHLRQGNYDKAVREYIKALNTVVDGDPYAQKESGGDKATSLYKKLIQAHVGAGEYDRAQKLLELVERSAKEEIKGRNSIVATGEDRQLPLPGRLIVSATKQALDQAASGSMSLKEFREACEIRYSEPRPATEGQIQVRSSRE